MCIFSWYIHKSNGDLFVIYSKKNTVTFQFSKNFVVAQKHYIYTYVYLKYTLYHYLPLQALRDVDKSFWKYKYEYVTHWYT